MRHVNLLPAEYGERGWLAAEVGGPETTKRILTLAGAATALVAVVLAGLYIHERSVVNDRKGTLSALEQQVAEAEAAAAKAQAEQASGQARLAAVQSITAQRMTWEKSLREFAQVLPANALVSTLQVQAPVAGAVGGASTTPTTGAAPTGFAISGVTSSQRAVALVLDRLALLPWLADVTLQTSSRSTGTGGAVQFSIGANTRSEGARP